MANQHELTSAKAKVKVWLPTLMTATKATATEKLLLVWATDCRRGDGRGGKDGPTGELGRGGRAGGEGTAIVGSWSVAVKGRQWERQLRARPRQHPPTQQWPHGVVWCSCTT